MGSFTPAPHVGGMAASAESSLSVSALDDLGVGAGVRSGGESGVCSTVVDFRATSSFDNAM